MPHIVCQRTDSIITRDQPDKPFNSTMGTKYTFPKRFAYTQKKDTYAGTYSLLVFASPIPIGSKNATEGWVKDSDWSFES